MPRCFRLVIGSMWKSAIMFDSIVEVGVALHGRSAVVRMPAWELLVSELFGVVERATGLAGRTVGMPWCRRWMRK